jgi:hypothetical protein
LPLLDSGGVTQFHFPGGAHSVVSRGVSGNCPVLLHRPDQRAPLIMIMCADWAIDEHQRNVFGPRLGVTKPLSLLRLYSSVGNRMTCNVIRAEVLLLVAK